MAEQPQESCACQNKDSTCKSISAYYADVSVPLKLRPYATVGNLETECCSEPLISLRQNPGAGCSCGYEITITQTICIRIPVEYGATADVGDACVICKKNQNSCSSTCR